MSRGKDSNAIYCVDLELQLRPHLWRRVWDFPAIDTSLCGIQETNDLILRLGANMASQCTMNNCLTNLLLVGFDCSLINSMNSSKFA